MPNQFGKLSELKITAGFKDNKTIIEDVFFTAPFKIMHPFYENGDYMTVMLLLASAGIMEGDRQRLNIRVKKDAKMEFVSQAYEKIHRMKEGHAERYTHIVVEPDASLKYTPLPTIPFADSDFRSEMEVELADETSRFVFSEVLTCGRVWYGEEFRYKRFQNKISIFQGGKIIYKDNTRYEPGQIDMRGFGMYEGFTHMANMIICNETVSDNRLSSVRELLDNTEQLEGGATRTAAGHIAVRILGMSGQKLTETMRKILNISDQRVI